MRLSMFNRIISNFLITVKLMKNKKNCETFHFMAMYENNV